MLLIPALAFGQSGGGNTQNSLLPEINPQDIEIRSEFRARFPGLRRQPILGFNPKPRVFQIDPNRIPFMESREDAVAGISVTRLSRPEPPMRMMLPTPDRTNLYGRVGYGSFVSPEAELFGFKKLNERQLVTGHLNMQASDGHLGNSEGGYRYLDVHTSYVQKVKEDLKLSVDVGGFSDYNDMFRLENAFLQNSIGKTAEKSMDGIGGEISLQKVQNSLEGWKLIGGGNLFGMNLDAGSSAMSGELKEQSYHASFSRYWAGKRMYETFNVSGRVQGGFYNSSSVDEQWMLAESSVEYSRLLNFSTHISASGGIAYASDLNEDKVYLVPEINLRHNLKDAVIITAEAYARPEITSAQEHHQYNRFLNAQTTVRHAYKMGAGGEIAFQALEGNRIFGGISYDHIKDYAYYQRNNRSVGGNSARAFYNVNYGAVNIFELYGGITQQLVPEKFWFDARIYGRRPSLTNGGDIPFEERLGVNGSLSYKPIKKLMINSWVSYTGQREDPGSPGNLEAFLLLNGGAEYQVTDRFGAYVKVLNIFGQKYEYWKGYQERPFQIFGGLTFKL